MTAKNCGYETVTAELLRDPAELEVLIHTRGVSEHLATAERERLAGDERGARRSEVAAAWHRRKLARLAEPPPAMGVEQGRAP